MSELLNDTPEGYAAAIRDLCTIPQDLLADLSHEVLDFLSYRVGDVDVAMLVQKLSLAGFSGTPKQVQGSVNALTLTFRHAIKQQVDAPGLATELKSFGASVWTAKAVNVVKHVWSERGAAACGEVQRLSQDVLNIGNLVHMKWKLGLSTQSSLAKNMGRAYVGIELTLKDSADNTKIESFELSLSQFQNFSKQMKDMQTMINEIA